VLALLNRPDIAIIHPTRLGATQAAPVVRVSFGNIGPAAAVIVVELKPRHVS
jgi:hypothetical protein